MYSPLTGFGVSVVTIRPTNGFSFRRVLDELLGVVDNLKEDSGPGCGPLTVEDRGEEGSGVLLLALGVEGLESMPSSARLLELRFEVVVETGESRR